MNATITFYSSNEDEYGAVTARRNLNGEFLATPHQTCAVDPKVIPYGTWVEIPDLANFSAGGDGRFYAHDTGSAVVSRKASLKRGNSFPVIDLYVGDVPDSELGKLMDKYGGAREFRIVNKEV